MSFEKYGDSFLDRILSKEELEIFLKRGKKVEFLAGRFAAKEAIAKAFKTGIGKNLAFNNISILPDENGALKVLIDKKMRNDIEVSISHCHSYAMAVSIIK
ncbi:MAG: holo-[acyl-carrier protein] synthase [Deferribacteres bacterium]|nr:holo-[acyl-carrier protein] synthase [Deferribacteres bacterium]